MMPSPSSLPPDPDAARRVGGLRWWVGCGLLAAAAEVFPMRESQVGLRLSSGAELQARVLRPEAQAPGTPALPAVMLFGGFKRGAAALDLLDGARPKVLASFDYPLDVPDRLRGLAAWRYLPAARRGIRDTLDGIGRLHGHLRDLPEVDPERITIVGVSLGAPFAVIAAAEDDIPGLAVIHGFGSVDEVIAHQFGRRWAEGRGDWVWVPAQLLGRLLTWYARIPSVDAHASRLAPGQQAWMLAATDDARIPPGATQSLRQAFARSQAAFDFEVESGGHLRGEDDPRIPELLRAVEDWMAERGLH